LIKQHVFASQAKLKLCFTSPSVVSYWATA